MRCATALHLRRTFIEPAPGRLQPVMAPKVWQECAAQSAALKKQALGKQVWDFCVFADAVAAIVVVVVDNAVVVIAVVVDAVVVIACC